MPAAFPYLIRPAHLEDAAKLGAIAPAAYAAAYADLWTDCSAFVQQLDTFSADSFAKLIENPNHRVLVAELNDVLVGFLSLRLDGEMSPKGSVPSVEAHRIYLLPQARGIGIGRQLILAAANEAESLGAVELRLSTFKHAKSVIDIYRRWGFSVVGETVYPKRIRSDRQQMIAMRATLTAVRSGATDISILRETNNRRPHLERFYQRQGYDGKISDQALCFSAKAEGSLIGLVRLEREDGLLVLRGMNVDPAWQRMGIGRRMLKKLETYIDMPCFCLPHSWLEDFYASIGFVRLPDCAAPKHLAQRLEEYHQRGEDPILMFRPLGSIVQT